MWAESFPFSDGSSIPSGRIPTHSRSHPLQSVTQRTEINLQPCLSPQTPICMRQVVPHNRAPDFQCIDCVVMMVLRTDEKLAVLWTRWEMRQTHTETWGWPGIQRLQFDSSWFEPVRARSSQRRVDSAVLGLVMSKFWKEHRRLKSLSELFSSVHLDKILAFIITWAKKWLKIDVKANPESIL